MPASTFLRDIHQSIIARFYNNRLDPGLIMADQFAVAAYLDEGCVTEAPLVYATVELSGTCTRGQMVVDWKGMWKKPPNVRLVKTVDMGRLTALLKNCFSQN